MDTVFNQGVCPPRPARPACPAFDFLWRIFLLACHEDFLLRSSILLGMFSIICGPAVSCSIRYQEVSTSHFCLRDMRALVAVLLWCHGFHLVIAGVTRRRRRLWPATVDGAPAVQHPALDAWSRAERDFTSSSSAHGLQPDSGSQVAACGEDAGAASLPPSQAAASALDPTPDFELADHIVDLYCRVIRRPRPCSTRPFVLHSQG